MTQWLNQDADTCDNAKQSGGTRNSAALFEALYQQLGSLAHSQMRHERAKHMLSATGLAHETWFRMAELKQIA